MKKIGILKNSVVLLFFLLFRFYTFSQSAIDQISYGVILDDPGMKTVVVKKDVTYLDDAKGKLHINIYSPPNLQAVDKRPAIIFLTTFGDEPGHEKIRDWGIYITWPQLIAARGYVGITMETDGERVQESIQGLFKFLDEKGIIYNIDKERLGVYAASANVARSTEYLMSKEAYKGIKAAALYYGRPPVGPFRKDLPVFFLISEGDMNPGYNGIWSEVLKNNAPWTIRMGTGMPHGFDANTDNDEARKLVMETISFWKNHLDPVPQPSWAYSKGRDVIGSLQMNHARAVSLLKSLTEENPADVQALLFYANELRQEKKFDEATAAYNKVLINEPKNVKALIALALISYSQNKDQEAKNYVARAENAGKMEANDYAWLGYFLLPANKNKEAAFYYEKALAMRIDAFDYYYLARAYAKTNDKENALKALNNSLKNGYGSKQQIENDSDFDLIKSDEKFKQLLSSVK